MEIRPQIHMKKNDLKLILFLALIAGLVFFLQRAGRAQGGEAIIYKNGEEYARLSLSENMQLSIGEGNLLVIEDGEARMQDADCPDQICVRHLPVSRTGESIVCLPNQVVVEIKAKTPLYKGTQNPAAADAETQEQPDVVAY